MRDEHLQQTGHRSTTTTGPNGASTALLLSARARADRMRRRSVPHHLSLLSRSYHSEYGVPSRLFLGAPVMAPAGTPGGGLRTRGPEDAFLQPRDRLGACAHCHREQDRDEPPRELLLLLAPGRALVHNPGPVLAARRLTKSKVRSAISAGSRRRSSIVDAATPGMRTHNILRFVYIRPRAVVVLLIESTWIIQRRY